MSIFKRSCCAKCLKKELIIEECKCNKKLCLNCLPHYNHNCGFDWRKDNEKYLKENNPKIVYVKVDTI